jgi:hypothetical protein
VNTLNKQPQTNVKQSSSSLGFELVMKQFTKPQTGTDSLDK